MNRDTSVPTELVYDCAGRILWTEAPPHPTLPVPGDIFVHKSASFQVISCVTVGSKVHTFVQPLYRGVEWSLIGKSDDGTGS